VLSSKDLANMKCTFLVEAIVERTFLNIRTLTIVAFLGRFAAAPAQAEKATNPIAWADVPDISMIRVGDPTIRVAARGT